MYKLFRTKQFIKDKNKLKLSNKHYERFIKYTSLLLEGKSLPAEARDHNLIGNYNGFRECHISGDLLLIYIIEGDYLKLTRIGSHSQLFI